MTDCIYVGCDLDAHYRAYVTDSLSGEHRPEVNACGDHLGIVLTMASGMVPPPWSSWFWIVRDLFEFPEDH